MQFTNVHAGICAFVGTQGSLIANLVSTLHMEELTNGQMGLQTALVKLIQTTADATVDDEKYIRPQLISTLPVYVDFPPLLKPIKSRIPNHHIVAAACKYFHRKYPRAILVYTHFWHIYILNYNFLHKSFRLPPRVWFYKILCYDYLICMNDIKRQRLPYLISI